MAKSKKSNGKMDVHVYLEPPLSHLVKDEAKREQRSMAQLIRFILTQHFQGAKP